MSSSIKAKKNEGKLDTSILAKFKPKGVNIPKDLIENAVQKHKATQSTEDLRNQKVTNKEPIGNQLVITASGKKGDQKSISNQLGTQKVTNKVTNKEPIGNQLVTKTSFSELSGIQRNITLLIFNKIKFSGDQTSGPLSLNFFAENCKTTHATVKTAIQRLVKKEILVRKGGKRGKGGWAKFSISKPLYNEMLQDELVTNKGSISNQLVTNKGANKGANWGSSSSSSNSSLIKNTNTTEPNSEDDWVQCIQTPENLKSLGLGLSHIKQLKDKFSLTSEQIQHGLESFSYDLTNGELERLKARGIQNIIGYFFGAMKSGGYNSVGEGFITAEELAEKEMLERLKLKKEQREKRKKELENLLFEEWLEKRTKEEILEIDKPVSGYLDMIHRASVKEYFLDNEFEKMKENLSQ